MSFGLYHQNNTPGHYHLVARDKEPGENFMGVLYGNVFTPIDHRRIAVYQDRQVYRPADSLHILFVDNAKLKEDVRVPRILEIGGPEAPIMARQIFNISVEGPFNYQMKAKSGVR